MLPTSESIPGIASRLRACPLFRTVSEPSLEAVLNRYRFSISKFGPEAIVAFRGDEYDRLLVLLSGSIRTEMSSSRGNNYAVAEHTAPIVLAPALLFNNHNSLPVAIVSTTPVELVRLPRATILELCQIEPAFLVGFLNEIGERFSILADKLRLSRLATIRERLADYLLDLGTRYGTTVLELPHSRRALAEILGVTRPALSRVFAELADQGLISYQRNHVQVLDPERLIEMVPE